MEMVLEQSPGSVLWCYPHKEETGTSIWVIGSPGTRWNYLFQPCKLGVNSLSQNILWLNQKNYFFLCQRAFQEQVNQWQFGDRLLQCSSRVVWVTCQVWRKVPKCDRFEFELMFECHVEMVQNVSIYISQVRPGPSKVHQGQFEWPAR